MLQEYQCPASDECQLFIDITLESADGQKFGAHSKTLEVYNGAFPIVGTVIHDINDIVYLTEDADILVLLLRFSHNEPLPELAPLGIDTVLALAEAADKYENHFALSACRTALSHLAHQSPINALRIVSYKLAFKDYTEIDELVRSTMDIPTHTVVEVMKHNPQIYLTYTLYKEVYMKAIQGFRLVLDNDKLLTDEYARSCPRYGKAAVIFNALLMRLQSPTEDKIEEARGVAEAAIGPGISLRNKNWNSWVRRLKDEVLGLPTWEKVELSIEGR
ncbi:hypothetical protein VNI00_018310 [Paramarasmius palmivorus]|uniref:BTB domain-containing protein n=1 Tax=Paramarasmius palmivorus TaxID=297713 RepID=A0AAW0AYQ9_9AGAR